MFCVDSVRNINILICCVSSVSASWCVSGVTFNNGEEAEIRVIIIITLLLYIITSDDICGYKA